MNRTAKSVLNLVVATGIAAAGLTLSTTAAHAETPNGPGQVSLAPNGGDPSGPVIGNPTPEPTPLPVPPKPKSPKPAPKGPGDLTDTQHCTHGCGGGDAPKDLADAPKDEPTAPAPAPTGPSQPIDAPAGGTQDQGCFTGCDLPEEVLTAEESATTPTRVDAGVNTGVDAGTGVDGVEAAPVAEDSGFGLAFYLGLGLVSLAVAVAIALVARRLVERGARA